MDGLTFQFQSSSNCYIECEVLNMLELHLVYGFNPHPIVILNVSLVEAKQASDFFWFQSSSNCYIECEG